MILECPYCNKTNDAHASLDLDSPDAKPAPGDYTLCIHCLEISRMGNENTLLKLIERDIKDLKEDGDNWNILQEAIRFIKAKKP